MQESENRKWKAENCKRIGVAAGLLSLLVLLGAARLDASQGTAAGVVIRVSDPSGTAVKGALVQVTPAAENSPGKMETNEKGELALPLRPGKYRLLVKMPGFRNFNEEFEVKAEETAQVVPVALEVAYRGDFALLPAGGIVLRVAGKDNLIQAVELKGMARKTVVVHNPHANADEKYEGVVLADLLTKYGAPLGKDLRGKALANYVVATGSDGYKAVYSLAEVDPSFHPGDVIVADTMDGKPLDAHSGPFRLVSTEDLRPARGVRNLVGVEVRGVE